MTVLKRRWRRFEIWLQKSDWIQGLFQRLISNYLIFTFRSIRWEIIGTEGFEADVARGEPAILCCWHNQLGFTPMFRKWDDHVIKILASDHADGRLASEHLKRINMQIIELATSGDNRTALRAAVKALRGGHSVGIAVDGPMGPVGEVKPGAIVIGGLSGKKVTPIAFAAKRTIRMRSWDGFIVALPWTRGVIAMGEGFTPTPRLAGAELDAACIDLGERLNALTAQCEERL